MIKTIIIDDNRKFLQRIENFLSSEGSIEVVGEANNGFEAIKLCKELRPDLVIMDIRMPLMDGIQAAKILKDKFPVIIVIILTVFDFKEYRDASINAGTNGYVLKKKIYTDLLPKIYQLFQQNSNIPKDM